MPLPVPMLTYYQFDNKEEILMKLKSKYIDFHSQKCSTWKACLAAILSQGSEIRGRNFTENWIK